MKFAYADPPYPKQALVRYATEAAADGRVAREVNHELLITHLCDDFDSWALSTSVPALRLVLPLCPPEARVLAWTKGWCSWKPNNWPAYAWEPVILFGARHLGRSEPSPRDWMMCNVSTAQTVETKVVGTKPPAFCRWLFHCAGLSAADELVDIFPGSGAVTRAWQDFCNQQRFTFVSSSQEVLAL